MNSAAQLATFPENSAAEETIYDTLRRHIVELRLKPGSLMSIKDICAYFDAGRSPVRDALIRLEQEGLIDSLPQRGTMISKIDFRRVEEERFLRCSVEERVMQEFMARHTPSDFTRLESLIWEQTTFVNAGNPRGFLVADDAFHTVFYEAVDRLFCAEALRNVSGHYRRVRLLTCIDGRISRNVIRQHTEMLTALRTREMNALEDVFSRHLSKISIEEHVLMEKYPALFTMSGGEASQHEISEIDFLQTLFQ